MKMDLYTDGKLDVLRQKTDPAADAVVELFMTNPDWIAVLNAWEKLPATLPENWPGELVDFIKIYQSIPKFVDQEQIRIAQDFFGKNGSLYLALLGFYSLPVCYAYEDGARVLAQSKRITEEPGIRLAETALFVLDAFQPGNFISPEANLLSLMKVRLIHAFSRYFIEKYITDWNPAWGKPINQEDLIGTNLAFSLIVIRGFRKISKKVSLKEASAILHYWKAVGFYLGLSVEYWPENPKEAFVLEKMIRKRHLRPSSHGKLLMDSLLGYYRASVVDPALANISKDLVGFFIGQEAREALGIKDSIALPSSLYGLMLQFGLFNQQGKMKGYHALRKQFAINSKNQFGSEIKLQLPSLKRS